MEKEKDSKHQGRQQGISLLLPAEMVAELDRVRTEEHRSRCNAVRVALDFYLRSRREAQAK